MKILVFDLNPGILDTVILETLYKYISDKVNLKVEQSLDTNTM